MMTGEECFAIWTPDGSPWSAWTKPVLFSQIDQKFLRPGPAGPPATVRGALPPFARDAALVVDLPGRESVLVGLALAELGWRPVPLFNATTAPNALVDVVPMMEALLAGAETLSRHSLPPDAPPAFLLDADRMRGAPRPGVYDNRSITLPQDFPSATFLRSQGIRTVYLLQDGTTEPREDLSHVLLRWQQGGLALRWHQAGGRMGDLTLSPPSWFRKGWYRLVALLGLRRSNVGGFGAVIPEATSGGFG